MPVIGQRVAYIRVSTEGQNTARQLEGMSVDRTFEEKVSGKSTDRPELEAMLGYVRQGDEVVVHSMDRLARNLDDLRRLVQQLTKAGVKVTFVKEGMTFTGEDSPMSMLMLSMMGAFAEFERSLILERQREGIEIAKKAGLYKGRKPSLNAAQVEDLKRKLDMGGTKVEVAKQFGISRETLYAYLRAEKPVKPKCQPGWVQERVHSPHQT